MRAALVSRRVSSIDQVGYGVQWVGEAVSIFAMNLLDPELPFTANVRLFSGDLQANFRDVICAFVALRRLLTLQTEIELDAQNQPKRQTPLQPIPTTPQKRVCPKLLCTLRSRPVADSLPLKGTLKERRGEREEEEEEREREREREEGKQRERGRLYRRSDIQRNTAAP